MMSYKRLALCIVTIVIHLVFADVNAMAKETTSAQEPDARSYYNNGMKARNEKDYFSTVQYFIKGAELGDTDAQTELGYVSWYASPFTIFSMIYILAHYINRHSL